MAPFFIKNQEIIINALGCRGIIRNAPEYILPITTTLPFALTIKINIFKKFTIHYYCNTLTSTEITGEELEELREQRKKENREEIRVFLVQFKSASSLANYAYLHKIKSPQNGKILNFMTLNPK